MKEELTLIGATIVEELPRWVLLHGTQICDEGISPEKVMADAMDRIGTNKWSKLATLGFRLARVRRSFFVEAVLAETNDMKEIAK